MKHFRRFLIKSFCVVVLLGFGVQVEAKVVYQQGNNAANYVKLIKMKEITKPNYETWFNKSCWQGIEAACLFNCIDPDQYVRIKELAKSIYLKLFAAGMNHPDTEFMCANFTFDESL